MRIKMKSETQSEILIVDDNEDILFHLKVLLEENDYTIKTAVNGKEALKFLSEMKSAPDLIISDIMMPVMDGYEFFSSVSSHPQWNRIPFLFLTAKSTPEDIRLGKLLGVDDYITKPFKREDLLASISGKITRNIRSNLINKEIYQLLSSSSIKIEPFGYIETEELEETQMTRQHFELIADIIKGIEDTENRKEMANMTADKLEKTNPRFDRGRFLKASGVGE